MSSLKLTSTPRSSSRCGGAMKGGSLKVSKMLSFLLCVSMPGQGLASRRILLTTSWIVAVGGMMYTQTNW